MGGVQCPHPEVGALHKMFTLSRLGFNPGNLLCHAHCLMFDDVFLR